MKKIMIFVITLFLLLNWFIQHINDPDTIPEIGFSCNHSDIKIEIKDDIFLSKNPDSYSIYRSDFSLLKWLANKSSCVEDIAYDVTDVRVVEDTLFYYGRVPDGRSFNLKYSWYKFFDGESNQVVDRPDGTNLIYLFQ